MTGTTYGIVVGYDGSPGAAQALRWAAREAWARGTTLTVCLAWTPDHMELPTESALCDLARQHGQEVLTRGLPYAESVLGPGRVRAELLLDLDHPRHLFGRPGRLQRARASAIARRRAR